MLIDNEIKFCSNNTDLIMEVLSDMNLWPRHVKSKNLIHSKLGTFDLNTRKVKCDYIFLDMFKRYYSKKIIELAAKKEEWQLKNKGNMAFRATKWSKLVYRIDIQILADGVIYIGGNINDTVAKLTETIKDLLEGKK